MAPDNHTVAWNLDLSLWERKVDVKAEGIAKRKIEIQRIWLYVAVKNAAHEQRRNKKINAQYRKELKPSHKPTYY